eukprot:TRINITY_DN41594_c0_g1_i2.p1 TRINITY_DN41594_c0_g1~~TRINITY_DN41594_c0_g1_i2.p1  ORF type:complete len:1035 (+),score=195.58 TRINITY_DN41594_c0_g1_i2:52-3156(+)
MLQTTRDDGKVLANGPAGALLAQPRCMPVEAWTTAHVQGYLDDLGLAELKPLFREQEVTGPVLLSLTEADLHAALGVQKFGHRRRLALGIAQLRQSAGGSGGSAAVRAISSAAQVTDVRSQPFSWTPGLDTLPRTMTVPCLGDAAASQAARMSVNISSDMMESHGVFKVQRVASGQAPPQNLQVATRAAATPLRTPPVPPPTADGLGSGAHQPQQRSSSPLAPRALSPVPGVAGGVSPRMPLQARACPLGFQQTAVHSQPSLLGAGYHPSASSTGAAGRSHTPVRSLSGTLPIVQPPRTPPFPQSPAAMTTNGSQQIAGSAAAGRQFLCEATMSGGSLRVAPPQMHAAIAQRPAGGSQPQSQVQMLRPPLQAGTAQGARVVIQCRPADAAEAVDAGPISLRPVMAVPRSVSPRPTSASPLMPADVAACFPEGCPPLAVGGVAGHLLSERAVHERVRDRPIPLSPERMSSLKQLDEQRQRLQRQLGQLDDSLKDHIQAASSARLGHGVLAMTTSMPVARCFGPHSDMEANVVSSTGEPHSQEVSPATVVSAETAVPGAAIAAEHRMPMTMATSTPASWQASPTAVISTNGHTATSTGWPPQPERYADVLHHQAAQHLDEAGSQPDSSSAPPITRCRLRFATPTTVQSAEGVAVLDASRDSGGSHLAAVRATETSELAHMRQDIAGFGRSGSPSPRPSVTATELSFGCNVGLGAALGADAQFPQEALVLSPLSGGSLTQEQDNASLTRRKLTASSCATELPPGAQSTGFSTAAGVEAEAEAELFSATSAVAPLLLQGGEIGGMSVGSTTVAAAAAAASVPAESDDNSNGPAAAAVSWPLAAWGEKQAAQHRQAKQWLLTRTLSTTTGLRTSAADQVREAAQLKNLVRDLEQQVLAVAASAGAGANGVPVPLDAPVDVQAAARVVLIKPYLEMLRSDAMAELKKRCSKGKGDKRDPAMLEQLLQHWVAKLEDALSQRIAPALFGEASSGYASIRGTPRRVQSQSAAKPSPLRPAITSVPLGGSRLNGHVTPQVRTPR